jgi:hypothetical protein
MAPVWLNALDANHDGSVAREEFLGAFRRWGTEWDKNRKGYLDADALRDGFNAALAMGPGGPGRPGGGFVPQLLAKEGGRNGLSGAAGIVFEYVHADLSFEGLALTNVAVRYKGNGTFMNARNSDKKSLKLDLDEFVKGRKLAGVSKLNLHNNVTDASWMNEPLSYALYRDAGVPAPRTTYARVHVTGPRAHSQRYLGLYSIVENPDNRWAEANFGTRKGAIFKPVTPTLFQDLGNDWKAYRQIYDPKTDLTPAQQQRVMDFARLVTRAEDAEFARRLGEFVDVDAFSRFMAVTVWLSTLDSILTLGQNYILYLEPKSNRFVFVPWDLDHSFGNFGLQGSQEQRERLSIQKPWTGQNRFFERTFAVHAVRDAYTARLKEFQGTLFRPERISRQVDELATLLRPAVAAESPEKLENFDQVIAGKAVANSPFGGPGARGPGRGGPIGDPPKPIKGFVPLRHASVNAQLAGTDAGLEIGAPGGPGGPGGRPGGGPGFGPGNFIAEPVADLADADHNGRITPTEWNALAAKWWSQWDPENKGTVNTDQIVQGLSRILPGPPGGGPRGPGGPGGPPPR